MKKMLLKFKTAVTLMELLVVVVIISILTAFVIPNFEQSIQKAHERKAIINLKAIAAAQHVFRTQNNSFYPIGSGQWKYTADINADLNLNIADSAMSYLCVYIFTMHVCQAQYPPSPAPALWVIQIIDNWNSWRPYCNGGTCPTCQDQAGGGC